VLLLVVGLAIGVAIAAVVRLRKGPRWVCASLRPGPRRETPYRGDVPAAPPTLAQLIAAVREAGVPVRENARGFAAGKLRVTVADPARVELATIDIADADQELMIFRLALALVPLYGPLTLTEVLWGAYLVDGSRDAEALKEDRAERIREMARGIQARIAESQPAWNELARKL
jgi:hypothetical protein